MKQYFLVVDILGFSEIISNLSSDEADGRINEWIDLVKKLCSKYSITKYQLISDSLFIGGDESSASFDVLVSFSSELLSEAILRALPLRGAISYDEYTWTEELVYGKAVIAAHKHEQNQDWIGISCIKGLKVNDWGKLVCYRVPLKSGESHIFAAVRWDIPEIFELARLMAIGGLTESNKPLKAFWMNRLDKTFCFALYLKMVDEFALPVDGFNGISVLQVLEAKLLGFEDVSPVPVKRPHK